MHHFVLQRLRWSCFLPLVCLLLPCVPALNEGSVAVVNEDGTISNKVFGVYPDDFFGSGDIALVPSGGFIYFAGAMASNQHTQMRLPWPAPLLTKQAFPTQGWSPFITPLVYWSTKPLALAPTTCLAPVMLSMFQAVLPAGTMGLPVVAA